MALLECTVCDKNISTDALTCPNCGTTNPRDIKILLNSVENYFREMKLIFKNSTFGNNWYEKLFLWMLSHVYLVIYLAIVSFPILIFISMIMFIAKFYMLNDIYIFFILLLGALLLLYFLPPKDGGFFDADELFETVEEEKFSKLQIIFSILEDHILSSSRLENIFAYLEDDYKKDKLEYFSKFYIYSILALLEATKKYKKILGLLLIIYFGLVWQSGSFDLFHFSNLFPKYINKTELTYFFIGQSLAHFNIVMIIGYLILTWGIALIISLIIGTIVCFFNTIAPDRYGKYKYKLNKDFDKYKDFIKEFEILMRKNKNK